MPLHCPKSKSKEKNILNQEKKIKEKEKC